MILVPTEYRNLARLWTFKQILLFLFLFFMTKRIHCVSNLSPLNLLENTIFSKHTTSQKSVGDHHINDTFRLEQTGYMSPDIRRVYPSSACSYWESEGLAVLKHLRSEIHGTVQLQ